MDTKRIEIVTPVFNRREMTLQCLRSLQRIERVGLDIHIIVVDDGSTDGTADAIQTEFPDIQIVKGNGNLWYTAGTNRGIEAAMKHDPDYVLACNNDSIFDDDCVRNLVACAEKYPKSVVGAVLLNWEVPHKVFSIAPQWKLIYGGMRHWHHQTIWTIPQKPWEVDLIVGNCVLYPASVIREVGLMKEKLLIQYGDAEYTPRMKRRGWRLLIEPKARIFCSPNEPPPRWRQLSLRKKISALFTNSGNAHNLHRRFYSTVFPAPNKLLGVIAFPIFFIRLALGRSYESSWSSNLIEPPLAETYRDSVVSD